VQAGAAADGASALALAQRDPAEILGLLARPEQIAPPGQATPLGGQVQVPDLLLGVVLVKMIKNLFRW